MGLSAKTTTTSGGAGAGGSNSNPVNPAAPCRQQSVPILKGKISRDSGPGGASGASMGSAAALLSKQARLTLLRIH